ncbi:MAG: putative RNA-binding protein (virulence factor B family) [Cyclobacteriaceae bacterium]
MRLIHKDMSLSLIEIGKLNTLRVIKYTDFGMYVGDDVEEILMPLKWVPRGVQIDEMIEVFIYKDHEDRLIATTMTPKLMCDQFGFLTVRQIGGPGAWLDWGLEKDLLVPFKEQQEDMKVGQTYLVFMYLDELTDRLVASTHFNRFLEREEIELDEGDQVSILVAERGEVGYTVIIDNQYKGLIFYNDVFKTIELGVRTIGYVRQIREDSKIDISLEPIGLEKMEPNAQKILDLLKLNGGKLSVGDKSSPDDIKDAVQMSKRNFKMAIGVLYKNRMITIEKGEIQLIEVV